MPKSQKQEKANLWKVAAIILLIGYLIMSVFLVLYILEKGKAKYYRAQMLNFCEVTNIQNKIIENLGVELPDIEEDCKYWILSYDD